MPHIKNDDQFSQRSFFFKSELEDLALGNKTSDLSLIFFILDTYLKWEWDKKMSSSNFEGPSPEGHKS